MSKNGPETSMHDWLALGELNLALSTTVTDRSKDTPAHESNLEHQRRNEEQQRLPLFLRLLSASRPLSSIPSLNNIIKLETEEDDDNSDYAFVDAVVSRLEEVGATHSAAEEVEVLTSHHVPRVCRQTATTRKRKRGEARSEVTAQTRSLVQDDSLEEIQAMDEHDDEEDEEPRDAKSKAQSIEGPLVTRPGQTNDSVSLKQDSREVRVVKVVREISKLVAESLLPLPKDLDDEEMGSLKTSLSLPTGSLLSEEKSRRHGLIMGGAGVGSTLTAAMHHLPNLQHRHVASALCRAAVPQTAELIAQLGANCPTAVPCLLRGCIDAFRLAGADQPTIVSATRASVLALSRLSHRELCRIRSMLQRAEVMVDVQLDLATPHDPVAVALLLIEHSSRELVNSTLTSVKTSDQGSSGTQNEPPRRRLHTESNPTDEPVPNGVLTLRQCLRERDSLAAKVVTCLTEAMNQLAEKGSNSNAALGRACLFLRSFAWLALSVVPEHPDLFATHQVSRLFERFLPNMSAGNSLLHKSSSEKDDFYKLLICCCLIVTTHAFSSGYDAANKTTSLSILKDLFTSTPPSLRGTVFRSRLALLLRAESTSLIDELLIDCLWRKDSISHNLASEHRGSDFFLELCKWGKSELDLTSFVSAGLSVDEVTADPSALLLSIELNTTEVSKVRGVLQEMLESERKCEAAMACENISLVIIRTVALASIQSRTPIPLVLPVQLQALSTRIDWTQPGRPLSDQQCQCVLQLLYGMSFSEKVPASPYRIDPRDFPLEEIHRFLSHSSDARLTGLRGVHDSIEKIVRRNTPDMLTSSSLSWYTLNLPRPEDSRRKLIGNLEASIRRALKTTDVDSSGEIAESVFSQTLAHLTSASVYEAAARALLSSPHEPLPFITYGALLRDPVVLLQCGLSVWKRRGLRRIALSTLWNVMEAGRRLVLTSNCADAPALELLISRDSIIVRCLLFFSSGSVVMGSEGRAGLQPTHCPLLTGIIRSLISTQRGLVAVLLRQGLSETAIDWLVEFVPECMHDALALSNLLTQKQLAAAERLTTADASLRIAVAHGGEDQVAAAALVAAALNMLIASFFLVLGPVGLPVNVVCEEDGRDVSKACRRAAFRMLRALQTVDAGRMALRGECARLLRRLMLLCKGEGVVSGVPGHVETSRKQLVKEIREAVFKAGITMGVALSM